LANRESENSGGDGEEGLRKRGDFKKQFSNITKMGRHQVQDSKKGWRPNVDKKESMI